MGLWLLCVSEARARELVWKVGMKLGEPVRRCGEMDLQDGLGLANDIPQSENHEKKRPREPWDTHTKSTRSREYCLLERRRAQAPPQTTKLEI